MDHRGTTIKVLDHGFIRLSNFMGDDLEIVRAARNSYDAAWRAGVDSGSDEKLLRYLWTHKHTTPFEFVEFVFEVKLPLFVARQWHRHRTWSYNEVSARYTELPDEFYVPDLDKIGVQSKSNKQGRTFADAYSDRCKIEERYQYSESCDYAFQRYNDLMAKGWPRELARCVLPAAAYTKMFAKSNLWNILHFITLRDDPHAQYEIQVYAKALTELMSPVIPVTMKIFEESRA